MRAVSPMSSEPAYNWRWRAEETIADLTEQNRRLRQSLQNAAATIRQLMERIQKDGGNGSET